MKYSNYRRYDKRRQNETEVQEGKWIVGWDYILFVLPVLVISFFMTTMFRELSSDVVDIAVFQLMMLVGGIALGFVVTGGNIQMIWPDRDYITKTVMISVMGFIITTIAMQVVMGSSFSVYMSSFDTQMHFALSAAPVEEALYSLVLTVAIWRITAHFMTTISDNAQTFLSVVFASLIVALLFAMGHYEAYNGNESILLGIAISRFIFSFLFLRTRNIMVPTLIHFLNNAMVLMMMLS